MSFYNFFKMVNKYAVRLRVQALKREHPHFTCEELSQLIIKDAALKCAILGAVTALPAVMPGVGTLVSLVAGTITNIGILTYIMSKMILEIAILYERNIENENTVREAMWAFYGAVGGNIASRGLSRLAVAGLSGEVFTSILSRTFHMLGLRIAQRTLVARIVPVLGIVFAGMINYAIAAGIGKTAINYYSSNPKKEIDGKTIILEGEYEDL